MFTIATLQIFASEELRPISCENFPAESVFLFSFGGLVHFVLITLERFAVT